MTDITDQKPYDPRLLDEPEYKLALDLLLTRLSDSEPEAYERTARAFPRFAAPLLDAALRNRTAEARLSQNADAVPDSAARHATSAGIAAAFRDLGLTAITTDEKPVLVFSDARKASGWNLAETSRRLHLPTSLVLLLERGQITTWTEKLTDTIAAVFETTREQAEKMLQASAGNYRSVAAAYSAQGDPDTTQVSQNRQQARDFAAELEKAHASLTPEQRQYWFET
jgi:hypothetical protein